MKYLCVFLCFLFLISTLRSESFPDPPLANLSSFSVIDDPILGDTVTVRAVFEANVTDTLWVGISFDPVYKDEDASNTEKRIFDYHVVQESSTYTVDYELIVQDTGLASIRLDIQNLSPNFENGEQIDFTVDVATTISTHSDPLSGIELDIPFENYEFYEILTTSFLNPSISNVYTFNISGNVTYGDWNKFDGCEDYTTFPYVRLWFREKKIPIGEEYWRLYHPVPLSGSGSTAEYIEGIHYAKCDKDGNYQFNFSFSGFEFDDQENWEILIVASLENDVIFMTETDIFDVVHNVNSNYRSQSLLSESKDARSVIPINNSTTSYTVNNVDLQMRKLEGRALRYNTIANEFIKAVFDNNMSFDIPCIRFFWGTQTNISGQYSASNADLMTTISCDNYIIVMYHEYAHYVHHSMAGRPTTGIPGTQTFSEGFARFFAEECQQWASNNYDYEYYNTSYSYEADPFRFDSQGRRFPKVAPWGTNGSRWDYKQRISRMAGLMHNLYDCYDDSDFGASPFFGLDNEDVSLGRILFEFVSLFPDLKSSEPREQTIPKNEFYNSFKAYIVPNDELEESMDLIFDNMYSLSQPIATMRSAQIKGLHYTNDANGFVFHWQSRSYDDDINYSWDKESPDLYKNAEDYYKIYKLNGNNEWDSINVVQYVNDQRAYECWMGVQSVPPPAGSWKVSACKAKIADDPGRDSYDAPTIIISGKTLYPNIKNNKSFDSDGIFPNPAIDVINLYIGAKSPKEISVVIYDGNGKKYIDESVKNLSQNSNDISLDVASLPSGQYIVNIILLTKDGRIIIDNKSLQINR